MTEEEKAAESKKEEAKQWKEKGNKAYKAKKFEDAIQNYDKAIECDPEDTLFVTNKAAVYLEKGETDKCIELCDSVIERSKDGYYDYKKLSKAYARKGAALAKQSKFDEAMTMLTN